LFSALGYFIFSRLCLTAEARFISDAGKAAIASHRPALLAAADALDALLAPAQCPQLVQAIVQVKLWGSGMAAGKLEVLLLGGWRAGWGAPIAGASSACAAGQTVAHDGDSPRCSGSSAVSRRWLVVQAPCLMTFSCLLLLQKYIMLSPDEVAEWEADPERCASPALFLGCLPALNPKRCNSCTPPI
jgi:hypothetical protein